jgi:hypothetical protein
MRVDFAYGSGEFFLGFTVNTVLSTRYSEGVTEVPAEDAAWHYYFGIIMKAKHIYHFWAIKNGEAANSQRCGRFDLVSTSRL